MRLFTLLLVVLALSSCSVLDQIQLNEQARIDPTKIYLDFERVRATKKKMDRYACRSGAPLYCERFNSYWDCRCP